jgi:hypothetical protein
VAEGHQTEPVIGPREAVGVRQRLGNLQPFFPQCPPLSKRAEFGMAHGQPGTGEHRRRDSLTEEIVALGPAEGRHGLPEADACPTVVTLRLVGAAEELVRQRLQDVIPTRRTACHRTLARGDDLGVHAPVEEMLCQQDTDPSQPTRIVEGHCEGLGLA